MKLVPRQLAALDLTLEPTELGDALVTTPEQTLIDLIARPGQGGMPAEAAEAVLNLQAIVRPVHVQQLVDRLPRVPRALREFLERVQVSDD